MCLNAPLPHNSRGGLYKFGKKVMAPLDDDAEEGEEGEEKNCDYASVQFCNRRADSNSVFSAATAGQAYYTTAHDRLVRVISIFCEEAEAPLAEVEWGKRERKVDPRTGCNVLTFRAGSEVIAAAEILEAVHVVEHVSQRGAVKLLENRFFVRRPVRCDDNNDDDGGDSPFSSPPSSPFSLPLTPPRSSPLAGCDNSSDGDSDCAVPDRYVLASTQPATRNTQHTRHTRNTHATHTQHTTHTRPTHRTLLRREEEWSILGPIVTYPTIDLAPELPFQFDVPPWECTDAILEDAAPPLTR
jgi:hypothetical protein